MVWVGILRLSRSVVVLRLTMWRYFGVDLT
nr:MAG TPA: hypothetical protein [Caudoviricetes sp.]